jgi:hypothetical protein
MNLFDHFGIEGGVPSSTLRKGSDSGVFSRLSEVKSVSRSEGELTLLIEITLSCDSVVVKEWLKSKFRSRYAPGMTFHAAALCIEKNRCHHHRSANPCKLFAWAVRGLRTNIKL